jgi:23S rRNA pseudouridine1911/1915/1917 synthase
MHEWLVDLPDRLDSFIAKQGVFLSRSKAQKAIENGLVSVNDIAETSSNTRLQEGDKVTLESTDLFTESALEPTDLSLPLLYEDDACAVMNKPAGIAVHPGTGMAPGEKTILHGIAYLYKKWGLAFSGESVLVHRLDKETTGCLLIAKNPAAHMYLQKQFETRTVDKRYLALVAGIPDHKEATIDAPIGRNTAVRTKMSVQGLGKARSAQTSYRIVDAVNKVALLECTLHTGRTHQVRVHMHSIGHPILGDSTYLNTLSERIRDEYDIRSLCLHAWKLTFESPADEKKHAITAEPPSTFREVVERMGIRM